MGEKHWGDANSTLAELAELAELRATGGRSGAEFLAGKEWALKEGVRGRFGGKKGPFCAQKSTKIERNRQNLTTILRQFC
jgi:hypothetical protein